MEIMDFLDVLTPTYGDYIDFIPIYIGNGHSGRTQSLNRTEEVRGSNPLKATHDPLNVGGFIMFDSMGVDNIPVQQCIPLSLPYHYPLEITSKI